MNTIASKVVAAGIGSGLGAAVAAFLTWLLGATAWGSDASAEGVQDAVAAVPAPVSALLLVVITMASTVAAGYARRETVLPTLPGYAPADLELAPLEDNDRDGLGPAV